MSLNSLLLSIISSSFVATVASSLINLYLKRLDFKNEYFKLVIQKRLEAYEHIELIIANLKTSALDEADQKAYHLPFFNTSDWHDFSVNQATSNSYSLWLNATISEKLSELNTLMNQFRFDFDISNQEDLIKGGKKYYDAIATIRVELENLARTDVLTLYDFKGIEKKRVKDALQIISIRRERISKE
jgi:hypothetical protein